MRLWGLKDEYRVLKHPGSRGGRNVDRLTTYEVQTERRERLFLKLGSNVFTCHKLFSPGHVAASTNRLVMFPYASIRRSRRKGQWVRLNSTFSRSHGTTSTSSLSTGALATT